MQPLPFDDLNKVVAENPVVYLYLHRPTDMTYAGTVLRAARPLLGSPPVYTSSSQQFFTKYSHVCHRMVSCTEPARRG